MTELNVVPDPYQILAELSLNRTSIRSITTLSGQNSRFVWRVRTADKSFILKCSPEPDAQKEIRSYRLLKELGVPTVQLLGSTGNALLLNDIDGSTTWRLAVQADMSDPLVARAIGLWYKHFHDAGSQWFTTNGWPDFLGAEVDELTPESIIATGQALDLATSPVWQLAARHIDQLKAAIDSLGITLNYNDFHWSNLALSRELNDEQLLAIVFDYHLLGRGMRYSDLRNVTYSLSGPAVRSFRETYGPVDPREEILDRPLAALFNLLMATRLPEFPYWAQCSLEYVTRGELEKDIVSAIEAVQSPLFLSK